MRSVRFLYAEEGGLRPARLPRERVAVVHPARLVDVLYPPRCEEVYSLSAVSGLNVHHRAQRAKRLLQLHALLLEPCNLGCTPFGLLQSDSQLRSVDAALRTRLAKCERL